MAEELPRARASAIRRLARRRAARPLVRALEKSSAADINQALQNLTATDTRFVLERLPADQELGGEVMLLLGEEDFSLAVKDLPADRMVGWLRALAPDDQADLVGRLPEDFRTHALGQLEQAERRELEELMAWPEDSAGGIMSPFAFRVHEDTTCREAIAALQEQSDAEMAFYLYLENDAGQLVGVTSLRQLLLNSPNEQLSEIMTPDVISVLPETDQEEVARIAARYDLLAVPVVDDTNHFLGIVTIDDVIDVVREEAAEDMLKMAGVGDTLDPMSSNALRAARQRLTWLVLTAAGGIGLSEVIGAFESTLARQAVLAGFIPVIMGIGGNVGIQAATISIRNMVTGQIKLGQGSARHLFREARVGLLMGITLASVLAGYSLLRYDTPLIGLTVGLSMLGVVSVSTVLGSLIPLTLDRVGVDPAIAMGPFVTTSIDTVAIVMYLAIAGVVFGL